MVAFVPEPASVGKRAGWPPLREGCFDLKRQIDITAIEGPNLFISTQSGCFFAAPCIDGKQWQSRKLGGRVVHHEAIGLPGFDLCVELVEVPAAAADRVPRLDKGLRFRAWEEEVDVFHLVEGGSAFGEFEPDAIEPEHRDVAVVREQLLQLAEHEIGVGRVVAGVVSPVPKRIIDRESESELAATFRQLPNDIPPAGRGHDAIAGVLGRPQAKAIVVLRGKNDQFHAGGGGGFTPGIGVQLPRIEAGGVQRAVAPFLVVIGVDAEMEHHSKS